MNEIDRIYQMHLEDYAAKERRRELNPVNAIHRLWRRVGEIEEKHSARVGWTIIAAILGLYLLEGIKIL